MVRVRTYGIVQYGKFKEYASLATQLSDVCESKGYAKLRFMAATAGPNNEVVFEAEYPDLAAFQAENHAQMSDRDFMDALRASGLYFYPQSSRIEIYEDIFDFDIA